MRVTTQMLNESSQRAGIPGIGSGSIGNNALLKAAIKNKKGNSLLSSLSGNAAGKKACGKSSVFDNDALRQAADVLEKKAAKLSLEDNEDEAEKMRKIADKLLESVSGNYSQDGSMYDRYYNNYDFWG